MPTIERNKTVTTNESSVGLKEYTRLKLELADIVRALKQRADERRDEVKSADCRKLLTRLAEDRFNLVVVGQFSRGKSSLMNAILGVERLPTSVLPLTSVITTVSYGDRERVLIHWKWTSYPSEVPLADLSQFVTQEGNPGNEKRVAVAEVQLAVELLRLGFYFIDTPGIGSAIAANTVTTTEFLPEADAVIFVTSVESPLTEAELQFLRQVRQHVRKIFLVMNKLDLISPEEQASVAAFTQERLREVFGDAEPLVYFVSARDGLKAKLRGEYDERALAGLPQLEAGLVDFLKIGKARELLQRVADRTADILTRQALEVHISQALSTEAEKAKQLEEELLRRANEGRAEFDKIIGRLRTRVGLELPRYFEPELGGLITQLKAELPVEIDRSLAALNIWRDDSPADPSKVVQDIAQERFVDWLTDCEQSIGEFLRGIAAPDLQSVEQHVTRLTRISAEAIGADVRSIEGGLQGDELFDDVRVVVRGIQFDAEELAAPWWLAFAPLSFLRSVVRRRMLRKLDGFLSVCMEQGQTVLQRTGEDWIDRLKSRMQERIGDLVKRQREIIRRQVTPEEVAVVERLSASLDRVVAELGIIESKKPSLELIDGDRVPRSDIRASCVICVEQETKLFDFMRRRQYELQTRGVRQQTHAKRGGFCGLHTWQYEAIASPQGVCSAYPPVLESLSDRLRSVAKWASSPGALADALEKLVPRPGTCEACELMAEIERATSRKVVTQLSSDEGTQKFPSLCVRHLCFVLLANPPMDVALLLVDEQSRVLDRVAEEMQRYSLKHEALRRHLATEQEQRAYEVGLSRLAGLKTIVAPWNFDES